MAKKKPNSSEELSVSAQLGRIAKLFALYLLKDFEDMGDKIIALHGAGFSPMEIAAMLGKTENYVRVTISRSKSR